MQRGGLSVFAAPGTHMHPHRRLTVSTRDWIGAESLTGNLRPVGTPSIIFRGNDPKALKDFYFAAPPLSKIWVPDSLGQGLVAVLAKWCMLKTMRVAQGNLSELAFFTYMDWEAHMNGQEYGARNSDVTRENRRSMDKLKIRRFASPFLRWVDRKSGLRGPDPIFQSKISTETWDNYPQFQRVMIGRIALQEVAELKYPAPYIPSVGSVGGGI